MLDGRGGDGEREEGYGGGQAGGFSSGPRQQSSGPREDFSADLDDEIPF
jgi:single-strand DNA-binding protein